MTSPRDFEVIRDPLWNNIRIDAEALSVLDSEPFQRLRYIRQLGHAFLVYPGATHTRFEHALGAYHLARRTLGLLGERGELDEVDPADILLVRLAALLHDIGHYPFSHSLEEAGLASHETLARSHLRHKDLRSVLDKLAIDNAEDRLIALITGVSTSPLAGLISGSLDLDKIEYLTRDARMCGVPYGTVDVDRLIHSITMVPSEGGRPTVAVHEKGVSALESLLFAKYQMYRNVYWHHAVRSATSMFKRLVRDAIGSHGMEASWIAHSTDEALMERLHALPDSPLANRLRRRQLYKRVLDIPATQIPPGAGNWIATNPDLVELTEDRLASDAGLERGDLLLDFPAKPEMLEVDLRVRTRDGQVEPLGLDGSVGRLGIRQIADELHNSARRLRVFLSRQVPVDVRRLMSLVEHDEDELLGELGVETSRLSRTH
ncbi:MAG: HD domain-containing protein [Gemmatimonadales bacterium]